MTRFFDTPHKVAVAGDWHGNTDWAIKALHAAHAQGATHVVHLGDTGYRFTQDFLTRLERTLADLDMVLGFVDGNHEDFLWLLAQPVADDGARYLTQRLLHLPRGLRWTWGEVSLLALGGAHSVDRQRRIPGESWWHQERITMQQAYEVMDGGHADVMFTHDVPAGVPVQGLAPAGLFPIEETRAADTHRDLLRHVTDVVRPHALWHGHYHARYDSWLHGLDYQTRVRGLDCDQRVMRDNVVVVTLDRLGADAI